MDRSDFYTKEEWYHLCCDIYRLTREDIHANALDDICDLLEEHGFSLEDIQG